MGHKLSYTTGSLYAWSSCMQWGVWVWTVEHWVVLVQVIYCSKGGWVLFLKKPTASLRGDHELQPQSWARSSFPLSAWLSVLFFFSSPAKTTPSGQGYEFCWWRRYVAIATALPTSSFVYCCKHQIVYGFSLSHFLWLSEASISVCGDKPWPASSCTWCLQNTLS